MILRAFTFFYFPLFSLKNTVLCLFKAFNASRDISEGDGLGLPICALRAEKMGGSLTIDGSVKGACFILTIHG